MSKVNVDKMYIEMLRQNQQWFDGLNADIQKQAVEETAKDTVQTLRATSPKDTGEYARNWKCKKDNELTGRWRYSMVVYNDEHYRLTHLLENGHAKVNGGRTQAQPHIAPAEKIAEELLFDRVLDLLSK